MTSQRNHRGAYLLCLIIGIAIGLIWSRGHRAPAADVSETVSSDVTTDTLTAENPQPTTTRPAGTIRARLPLPGADKSADAAPADSIHGAAVQTAAADSVEVEIPIEQKEYSDSTFHAWISGYAVNLDSIHTYTRREVTTIVRHDAPRKRWHIGPGVGVALSPRGIQPAATITLTYSLFAF